MPVSRNNRTGSILCRSYQRLGGGDTSDAQHRGGTQDEEYALEDTRPPAVANGVLPRLALGGEATDGGNARWLCFTGRTGRIEGVKFIYTRHARLRIQQRLLAAHQIESAVRAPDRLVPSFKGRMIAQKRIHRRTLEVVYRPLTRATIVITAYWLDKET